MIAALVLAAGASTRMGRTKALLPDCAGDPFVTHLARVLISAGVPEIVIVTGADHDAIADAARAAHPPVAVRLVRNPEPSRGQLSSLWVGLEALERPGLEGLLVAPVDVPLVNVSTVITIVEAWRRTRAPVVRPAKGARHGHPVLFDRCVFEDLRRAPLEAGAKAVVRACGSSVVDVPVEDEGCLRDMDTPEDYERYLIGSG